MEARRLAIICSHIRPGLVPGTTRLAPVSRSNCHSCLNSKQWPSGSDEGNSQNGCVFCKIIRGESPAFKLYEDDVCLCILDTNPLSSGSYQLLQQHFSFLSRTEKNREIRKLLLQVVAAMCSKVPFISSAIMKATGSDSFNLLVNNGTAAGQVIFHTHIHIIPRKALDSLWASEGLRRRPLNLDREASRLADRVREQLSLSENSKNSKGEGSGLTEN
ncbi:histidine triad nucleotide-binding protein 2 [Pyrus ussuriensis x Pyrus communis]|uniref:Histidine triad nucleotide-binding protein 2 n=1 Tax=Pyrus ussuriensis x Pyrus communis TaxID=2448454 RepID=A0A5N5IA96_9ROSA|nr:histidine triad nucleotide-binding protein 2 [Pyrus ussuriensis x Pyrus communis]